MRRGPVRWAAARNPHYEPSLLLSQLRQCRAVHALSTQHVHVIQLRELFGREYFGGAEDHVPFIVDDYVEASRFAKNLLHRSISRLLRTDVEFCCPKINIFLGGKLPSGFDFFSLSPASLTHRRINRVACLR